MLWAFSLLITPFAQSATTSSLLARSGLFPGRMRLWAELAVALLMMVAVILLGVGWLDWLVREVKWRIALAEWAKLQSEPTLVEMQDHKSVRSARGVLQHELRLRGEIGSVQPEHEPAERSS